MPKPSPSIPTEHAEQCALMRWVDTMTAQHSQLRLLHAIPNGGARARLTAAKLKAEGVKPGVPDLFLPAPRGTLHGLYIEMKRSKGSTTRSTQKWWHLALRISGYHVVICKSAQEAQTALLEYLSLPTDGPEIRIPAPSEDTTTQSNPKLPSKARVTDYRPAKTKAKDKISDTPPPVTRPRILGPRLTWD